MKKQLGLKYIGKSKYKNVYLVNKNGVTEYMVIIKIKNVKCQKNYKTEIEAARSVDMFLIKNGKEPVNILKRK